MTTEITLRLDLEIDTGFSDDCIYDRDERFAVAFRIKRIAIALGIPIVFKHREKDVIVDPEDSSIDELADIFDPTNQRDDDQCFQICRIQIL